MDEASRVVGELRYWTTHKRENLVPGDKWVADLHLRRLAAHLSNRAHGMRGFSSPVDDDEEYERVAEHLSGLLGFRSWTHPSDAGCY